MHIIYKADRLSSLYMAPQMVLCDACATGQFARDWRLKDTRYMNYS